ALGLHLLDVGTGSEGFLRAREKQTVLTVVGVVRTEHLDQLLQHFAVEGIEGLRAVQRDERHRAAPLDQDAVVLAHSWISGNGVHCSLGGSGANRTSSISSDTSVGVAGSHCGSPVLSISRARTPSRKSCVRTTRPASAYSARISSAKLARLAPSASSRSDTLHDSGLLVPSVPRSDRKSTRL